MRFLQRIGERLGCVPPDADTGVDLSHIANERNISASKTTSQPIPEPCSASELYAQLSKAFDSPGLYEQCPIFKEAGIDPNNPDFLELEREFWVSVPVLQRDFSTELHLLLRKVLSNSTERWLAACSEVRRAMRREHRKQQQEMTARARALARALDDVDRVLAKLLDKLETC